VQPRTHARAGIRHPFPHPHSPTAPQWARSWLSGLHHTQLHTPIGRTPLDEWSARRTDLYLKIRNTHHRQPSRTPARLQPAIPASVRPQTHALRPRAHWDRPDVIHIPTKHRMPTFNGSLLTASISKANDNFRTAAMTIYILQQHCPCKCCMFSRHSLPQTLPHFRTLK
jgi:hypothetical protein